MITNNDVIHELALVYVKNKINNQSPAATTIAKLYIESRRDIENYFKQQRVDLTDEAPPWPE